MPAVVHFQIINPDGSPGQELAATEGGQVLIHQPVEVKGETFRMVGEVKVTLAILRVESVDDLRDPGRAP